MNGKQLEYSRFKIGNSCNALQVQVASKILFFDLAATSKDEAAAFRQNQKLYRKYSTIVKSYTLGDTEDIGRIWSEFVRNFDAIRVPNYKGRRISAVASRCTSAVAHFSAILLAL